MILHAFAFANVLDMNYRPFWEERHPGVTVAIRSTFEGDVFFRVATATRADEFSVGPDWIQAARRSKDEFGEKMRELDARVFQIATELTKPPAPAQEIPVVERGSREYGTAEA